MTKSGWIRLACAALFAFMVARYWFAYDALPERVASHFDGAGRPDGYMLKDKFLRTIVLLQLLLPSALLAMRPLMLACAVKGKVNVPHPWYYLAPARREASIAKLASLIDEPALAGAISLAALSEQTLRAQLTGGSLAAPALTMALFGVFMLMWVARIFRAFPHPPSDDQSASIP